MADSRNEAILEATINDTEYDAEPQSRIEELLLELKEVIESGGGGGEITIDPSLSPTSPNAVRNSAIYAALASKADTTYVDEKILDEIGDITTFEYYLCSDGEYDAQGVPTVVNPDTNHIYLTPTSGTNLNMYAYINNAFTFLGTTEVNLDGYAKTENLAEVAFSGDYGDLNNPPTIPPAVTVDPNITQGGTNPVESAAIHAALAQKANSSTVAAKANTADLTDVAFSGEYSDLLHPPTIPTVPSNLVNGKKNGSNTELTINVIDSGTPAAGTADTVITIVKG